MFKKIKDNCIGDRAFYHRLFVLLIPMIIQQAITSFVSLLDNVMVGRLGTEAMSGVAISNQLQFIFNLTIFGGLAGASIFGAQFFGKGDHEGVRAAFRFKMIFSVVVSVISIAVFALFSEELIGLFLTDDGSGSDLVLTLSEAEKYLFVMLFGILPFAVSQSYSSTLREAGETVAPMAASVIAILTNLVLNWVLIFGKLGAPALGVVGAGIATVISRYLEAVYLIVVAHKHTDKFPFIRGVYKSLHIPKDIAKKIIITGTPLMLNEVFWSLGTTIINQSYSTRGLTVVAATNIAGTVWNLFCIIMFTMGNAVSIMVGQQLGAGEIEEAKRTDNRLLFFTTVLHIGVSCLIALTAPYIPLIYNTEPAVRELTTKLLLVDALALPIHAYVHVVYFTIRSGGKTGITFLFDCLYTWVAPLPLAFFLCRYTAMPIVTIFLCVQLVDIVKVIIGTILLRSGMWAKNLVSDENQ